MMPVRWVLMAMLLSLQTGLPIGIGTPGDTPLIEFWAPPHAIALHTWGITIPVDSVDITHAATYPNAITLNVVDTTRRGIEDNLSVHRSHAVHAWTTQDVIHWPDNLIFSVALLVEPPIDNFSFNGAVFHINASTGNVNVTQLNATATLASNGVTWFLNDTTLPAPFSMAATTQLMGCDDRATCDPPSLVASLLGSTTGHPLVDDPVYVGDFAPNSLQDGWIDSVMLPVWWNDVP